MAKVEYTVRELPIEKINQLDFLTEQEEALVDSFSVNTSFDQNIHKIELHVLDLNNTVLESEYDFRKSTQLLNAAGAGKSGASSLTLDPVKDASERNFNLGDVRILYIFKGDLFSNTKQEISFFIENISPDRTEIRALTNDISDADLTDKADALIERLNNQNQFSEFKLNFKENNIFSGLNAAIEPIVKGLSLVLKLHEPLTEEFGLNSKFTVEEEISDPRLFEVTSTVLEEDVKVPFLKGPNFNVELTEENSNNSEYFNYNELFSYPVTSSYYELMSLFNENSAQIAIDHTDYSSFIHFSSAEERLRNFKYKLELIFSYQDSISSIESTGYTQNGITGSLSYYQNLIKGIVNNFDHYDRYLYYESGSYSWPKQNDTRPYLNRRSNDTEATTWYTQQLTIASNYDDTNFDILANTVPTFIREDSNNESYLMFIHMIAQHFDNLWIYFKAVSDKYDTDNRLNFGISKDLVRSAIESVGVKLYDTNQNLSNLFAALTGEGYISGSELIETVVTATSGSSLEYLQPVSKDNYLKEVYKRIYHNLPTILKSKGTERGLRALINSFGIPSEILPIKIFGGQKRNSNRYVGPFHFFSSSLDKVRTDNTGSFITGSTLSKYTSTVKKENKYSDDLHTVEVGFDIAQDINNYISANVDSNFNIDDYIGDPRDLYTEGYGELTETYKRLLYLIESTRNPSAIVRLVKFFDNTIFRIVKDFIPARSNVTTGVVVKSHVLHRNKAKQVQAFGEELLHTGSIGTAFITGSDVGTFGVANKHPYTTNYSASFTTPLGVISRNVTDESPKITGEFSGSLIIAADKELNLGNPFKKALQPDINFNLAFYNLSQPIPPACDISISGSYVGEYYLITPVSSNGTVEVTYPTTVAATTSPVSYAVNFDIYEFISVTATATYPYSFDGWYTEATGGTLISTNPTVSIYYSDEATYGYEYYARFS